MGGLPSDGATVAIFHVAEEDLAVRRHLMWCGVNFPSAAHQHRALHLHLHPLDVSQCCDNAKDTRRHLRGVVICAAYDRNQTRALGKVAVHSLPTFCLLSVFCGARVNHELRVSYDLQSFSHSSQKDGVKDWRENKTILSPKGAESCQDIGCGDGSVCDLLVSVFLSQYLQCALSVSPIKNIYIKVF